MRDSIGGLGDTHQGGGLGGARRPTGRRSTSAVYGEGARARQGSLWGDRGTPLEHPRMSPDGLACRLLDMDTVAFSFP